MLRWPAEVVYTIRPAGLIVTAPPFTLLMSPEVAQRLVLHERPGVLAEPTDGVSRLQGHDQQPVGVALDVGSAWDLEQLPAGEICDHCDALVVPQHDNPPGEDGDAGWTQLPVGARPSEPVGRRAGADATLDPEHSWR